MLIKKKITTVVAAASLAILSIGTTYAYEDEYQLVRNFEGGDILIPIYDDLSNVYNLEECFIMDNDIGRFRIYPVDIEDSDKIIPTDNYFNVNEEIIDSGVEC